MTKIEVEENVFVIFGLVTYIVTLVVFLTIMFGFDFWIWVFEGVWW